MRLLHFHFRNQNKGTGAKRDVCLCFVKHRGKVLVVLVESLHVTEIANNKNEMFLFRYGSFSVT